MQNELYNVRSPRHIVKLTSSLIGTSNKIQYPTIPAHILCTQFSNQLNGKALHILNIYII